MSTKADKEKVDLMDNRIADANKKAQPAPAPLPGEVENLIWTFRCDLRRATPGDVSEMLLTLVNADDLHKAINLISDLTRRLADAEVRKAELSNTVEMVKRGLNGPWEPGGDVAVLAKEAGDALQSIGRLRAVGDWDWYRELPAKVEAIQVRAEAAEARVRELEKKAKGLESALAGEKAAREHDRSVRWALPETTVAGCPDDIRALGWAVAVHNDYKIGGVKHTFWLFTRDDRNVKGEGLTDAEALNEVRAALAATEEK